MLGRRFNARTAAISPGATSMALMPLHLRGHVARPCDRWLSCSVARAGLGKGHRADRWERTRSMRVCQTQHFVCSLTASGPWRDAALGPREDGSGATICSLRLGGEHFMAAQK